MMKKIVL